jgi:hypothetical protein
LPLETTAIALPVPAPGIFEFKEKSHVVMPTVAAFSDREEPRAAERGTKPKPTSADAGDIRHTVHGKFRLGHARRNIASHPAGRATHLAAHAHRDTPRHPVWIKKEARSGSIRHNL